MSGQTTHVDLVSLERSMFRRTLSHGLIDIAIPCVVVLFAVGPYTTSVGVGDFWGTAVFIPFWGLAALRFVYRRSVLPRLGCVDFALARRKRLRTWNSVALVLGAIALGVGAFSASQFGLLHPIFHVVVFSMFVLAGLALGAHYLDVRRFYVYAIVIASAPLTGELLWRHAGVPHRGYPVTFGFASSLCLVAGVSLLTRFIWRHPLPPPNAKGLGA